MEEKKAPIDSPLDAEARIREMEAQAAKPGPSAEELQRLQAIQAEGGLLVAELLRCGAGPLERTVEFLLEQDDDAIGTVAAHLAAIAAFLRKHSAT